jgi:uncharacterized protein YdaU (DUF1376 family)
LAEFPILPVNVSALIADTTHMSTEEFGAYVKILCALWLNNGKVRECDLQKICQLSRYKFSQVCENILRPLTVIDGIVSQKRLEDTRLKVRDKRAKAANSAAIRWRRPGACDRNANGVPSHVRTEYERNAIKISKKEEALHTDSSERTAPQQGASEQEPVKRPAQISRTEFEALMLGKRKAAS